MKVCNHTQCKPETSGNTLMYLQNDFPMKVSRMRSCPETKVLATSPSLLAGLQTPAHCNHIKQCLMYYVKFSGDLPGEGSQKKFNIAVVHV